MSIDRVAVRLQSESRTVAQLTALVGRSPTRSAERGTPVSPRHPGGPLHQVSSAVFVQPGECASLGGFVEALGTLLDEIGNARPGPDDVRVDLVVALTAQPLGCMVELNARQLAHLGAAGCGIVLDVYSGGRDEESAPPK